MRRFVAVPIVVAVLVVSSGGCGKVRYTREQARDRWVATYVEQFHITRTEAECIVDRFFGESSDVVLKPLTKGSDLSYAQIRRIGELAIDCGVGQMPTTPDTVSA
jgi:hypothetical protein